MVDRWRRELGRDAPPDLAGDRLDRHETPVASVLRLLESSAWSEPGRPDLVGLGESGARRNDLDVSSRSSSRLTRSERLPPRHGPVQLSRHRIGQKHQQIVFL